MISSLALLCGGLATRLYPLTREIPKAMIEVAGKPFIEHQLNLIGKMGIETVVICAGHLGNQVKEFVKGGERFGLCIRYSSDGEKLLGTGGAIQKALPMVDDPFFVMYGDSYLDLDLQRVSTYFCSRDKLGLMTVYRNENQWDRSNVMLEDERIVKYDKAKIDTEMKHIDYGLVILRKKAFDILKSGEVFDLGELYKVLVAGEQMLAYEVHERFYEIGSLKGLQEAEGYLKKLNRNNSKD